MRALVVVLLVLGVGIADADPREIERAIKIGGEGIALYEQRRYSEAYERFALADRMAHSVVFVLHMARCKRNLGELIAARTLLEQAAREALSADATEPMRRAQGEAARELEALAPRIPSLVVIVTGDRARGARVRVSSAVVVPGASIELDPGEHAIEVTAAGGPPVVRSVRLVEGSGRTTIELALGDPVTRSSVSRKPAWIAFGVGATGIAVGTATGIWALRSVNALEERCIERHCFASDRPAADRASRIATASTVSFTLAGVALTAGAVLWFWRPGKDVTIAASPNEIAIAGRF